jgi:hypothetical protein
MLVKCLQFVTEGAENFGHLLSSSKNIKSGRSNLFLQRRERKLGSSSIRKKRISEAYKKKKVFLVAFRDVL